MPDLESLNSYREKYPNQTKDFETDEQLIKAIYLTNKKYYEDELDEILSVLKPYSNKDFIGINSDNKSIESLDKLSFLEFIEKIEGPLGLVECTTDSDCSFVDGCNIRQPIKIINKNLKTMFNNILLSEITQ